MARGEKKSEKKKKERKKGRGGRGSVQVKWERMQFYIVLGP